MAEVRIQRIVKEFGPVRAVDDVSLTIHDKEFLVLLGPSGCGKTTLLRMIAGLEEPTAGEIFIDDDLVNFTAPKDRDIAMVFQNYALYPHMDVTSNISLGLKLHNTPETDHHRPLERGSRLVAALHPAQALPPPALRRAAATGGAGTLGRARAEGLPDG